MTALAERPVDVQVVVDVERFMAVLERARDDVEDLWQRAEDESDFRRLDAYADVIRSGRWGRWFVRGAMDPSYASPAARDRQVKRLARLGQFDEAAAMLRGWVQHR